MVARFVTFDEGFLVCGEILCWFVWLIWLDFVVAW